ncbi:MAG: hypothetical protein A3G57_01390 [Candidatus Andersenbacteria bacterium RIFCSPLOWO2_12_FULL_45_8]|nr:MAG: hypothetical protein A3B76_05665 [Candidatus Andersenbacteria bacterium RIFCSPHIGHO2_02_FULL_46_16]OGY36343.1 MAG: hypothetical protein A3I08_04465 [Candidatus Andersenbacteria bacterium RIFCSPLOWO2_02_FULL_46_11]OGY39326.1 MAG: hypothetical protein A3G57_01390 [Candidatus Andersenbacteria bacterium RIFCSPLOWO2_12_FULL_45_8]
MVFWFWQFGFEIRFAKKLYLREYVVSLFFNPTHIKRCSAVFIKERDNKLLIYHADSSRLLEEQAVSVEQQFYDLDLTNVRDVIVDLRNVMMISSHFTNWLIIVGNIARNRGGKLILCSLSEHVCEILNHLRFTTIITIAVNLQTAKQLLPCDDQLAPQ